MKESVIVLLVGFVTAIVVIWHLVCVRRWNNEDYDEMALNAPLVTTEKLNREEESAKIAELGHQNCEACGFENFTTVSYCNVCGEPLSEEAKKKAKKPKTPANELSGRRLRASKRKEWVRKVDVEGKTFWYREGGESRFPGYAVTFEHDGQVAVDVDAGKTKTLIQETKNVRLALVESAKTNPLVFPLGGTLDSASHEAEVVSNAAQDFPSKYAAFVAKSAAVLAPTKKQLLNVKVDKKFIIEQALEHVSCIDSKYVHAEIAMKYLQKTPGPAASLQMDWFTQLNELLSNPNTGLFRLADRSEQTFYLNTNSQHDISNDHLTFFYAAGRLLGRGLLEGKLWTFHLATPLLKIILGQPVSFTDLEFLDPEAFKHLDALAKTAGADKAGLDFSVTEKVNGELVTVDLIPNGRNVAVTDANKFEYLDRYFKHVVVESVSSQLYTFLKGIYEVVPQEMLMVLDVEELDYVLCGSDVIDVDDWKRHSKYNETIHAHPSMKWFWKHVRAMDLEHKKRLLHFTTGHTRVPIGGFAKLTNSRGHLAPFTIMGKELVISRVIRGQACFNHMELPTYVHERDLKANLAAIVDDYDYTTQL
uniref:HECT-type E3 ubiquitin transferase n=1 Tax=Globisporangium ultimum (strain ATCC 200006 / CBS 805.95 / DAOM BR144) TaxID=431595 RepID=K3X450_GLOUD